MNGLFRILKKTYSYFMTKRFKRFKDLQFKTHPIGKGVQATMKFPNGHAISVVGGALGLYGDGINNFEIWKSNAEEPQGYVTPEDIDIAMLELQSLPPYEKYPGFQ